MRRGGPAPSAALAGVPMGVQAQGAWAGRRQLFIRFAGEAETAVLYTAAALAQELGRAASRSHFHSLAVTGRDTLGNVDYLGAVFDAWAPPLPVMVDTDGQRPEAVQALRTHLGLVQVTLELGGPDAITDRAMQTLAAAAAAECAHALVLVPSATASDGVLLRIVEQAHGASDGTMIVVQLGAAPTDATDRRWSVLLEQAAALHRDVRLVMRIPAPIGIR